MALIGILYLSLIYTHKTIQAIIHTIMHTKLLRIISTSLIHTTPIYLTNASQQLTLHLSNDQCSFFYLLFCSIDTVGVISSAAVTRRFSRSGTRTTRGTLSPSRSRWSTPLSDDRSNTNTTQSWGASKKVSTHMPCHYILSSLSSSHHVVTCTLSSHPRIIPPSHQFILSSTQSVMHFSSKEYVVPWGHRMGGVVAWTAGE